VRVGVEWNWLRIVSSGGLRLGVDGTGSGSCPMAGFCISGVEQSGSATRALVN
jgi:hypothetical protein